MSEIDGPAYDLESEQPPTFAAPATPSATPEPAPAAEVAPAATPEPAPSPEPAVEEQTIEVQGGQYVPLNALKQTRHELQQLKDEAKQLRDYFGQTQGWAPYVNFLQAHPELMKGEPVRTAPTEPAAPTKADPRAERLAQRLDLYTPEGKSDVGRAADILAVIDETADAKSQAAIRPLTQQQHYERSVANYNAVLQLKYPDGSMPDPESLAELWRQMPLDMTSDWRVAQTIADASYASGLRSGRIKAKPVAPPAPPPVLATESQGGRGRQSVVMTDFERSVARSRNMNDTTWADRTKGFTPKATNVLEDE